MPKVDISCVTAQRLMLDILQNSHSRVTNSIYELEKREVVGSELSPEEHDRLIKLREYQAAMQLVREYFTAKG